MHDVVVFATKPCDSSSVRRARVRCMDVHVHEVVVVVGPADDDTVETLRVAPHDCCEAVQRIAELDDGVAHIECDVTPSRDVVAMYLCVDVERLNEHMATDGFASEEFVVNLCRRVWREARVTYDAADEAEASSPSDATCARWRDDVLPMMPHQRRTVAWMQDVEARVPIPLRYCGNIHLGGEWYADTERECVTTDPSYREAELRGGICADPPGTGKTAATLRLILEDRDPPHAPVRGGSLYASRATLVVVPLNLTSQWTSEVAKFARGDVTVYTLLDARHLRSVDMDALCRAYDVVVTTFDFLRSCREYRELLETALRGRPRTRATISAWSRQRGHAEPLVEAVCWKRVVVDELHQVLDNVRDTRLLRLLDARVLWGLTGTPVLESDAAQRMYLLLAREKVHHPNLLAALVHHAVRSHGRTWVHSHPGHTRRVVEHVQLSAEERMHVTHVHMTDVEAEVRRLTFVDGIGDAHPRQALEQERTAQQTTLQEHIRGCERTVAIMRRTTSDLQRELVRCEGGDVHVVQHALEANERELARLEESLATDHARLDQLQEVTEAIRTRLEALAGTCHGCGAPNASMCLPCHHVVCVCCAASAKVCPACGTPASTPPHRITGIGTKLLHIGSLLLEHAHESVILFVQWKSMVRGTRAYLRSVGVHVMRLDGNANQRTATLHDFWRTGGVLLLSLEESFAGLHLPHTRVVVFAHAIVGDIATVRRLEDQAIARCVRTGQTGVVQVHSFVIAASEEERLWYRTHADTQGSSSPN